MLSIIGILALTCVALGETNYSVRCGQRFAICDQARQQCKDQIDLQLPAEREANAQMEECLRSNVETSSWGEILWASRRIAYGMKVNPEFVVTKCLYEAGIPCRPCLGAAPQVWLDQPSFFCASEAKLLVPQIFTDELWEEYEQLQNSKIQN